MLVPAHAPEVERILSKAEGLRDLHIVCNRAGSKITNRWLVRTRCGGVAEILSSLTLLMYAVGIKTGWRVIQGRPDFFSITKKMHNALPGARALLQDSALLIDIKPVSTRTAIIRQQPRWEVLPCRRSSC